MHASGNFTLARLKQRYSQSNPEALRNPWVLAWMGVVAVFLSVNGLFVVLAVASNPGLVVENYYEQGRAYEQNAQQILAARNALRWETKLEIPERILAKSPGTYRFSGVDSRGVPLADADVQLTAYRPSDAGADFTTHFDPFAPGLYQAVIDLPLPGVWDLNVRISRGADVYQQSHRITVHAP
jgi:nitrogen fixation protein FixH